MRWRSLVFRRNRQMLPHLTLNDQLYKSPTHAFLVGQCLLGLRRIPSPDVAHVCVRQFGLTSRIALSSLLELVARVVGICAGKQAGRIAARRIITSVASVSFSWIGSILDEVGNSRSDEFASTNAKSSIAILVSEASPFPTLALRSLARRLINFVPETRNLRFRELQLGQPRASLAMFPPHERTAWPAPGSEASASLLLIGKLGRR